MMGPPPYKMHEYEESPRPKGLLNLVKFGFKNFCHFFYRLFYIFGLVWETSPFILVGLSLLAVMQGVLPVLTALLSKDIINSLQESYGAPESTFTTVLILLIVLFVYKFSDGLIARINTAVTRIAGELVVNTTRLKIMAKAQQIDIASFDRPDFYEKLENANREAGIRPIQILGATFTLLSKLISIVFFAVELSGISVLAAIIILVLSLPSAIVNFIYRKKTVVYFRRSSKERRQMGYFSDLLVNKDMVKEIRLFGIGQTLINRYKIVFRKYYAGLKNLIIKENILHCIFSVISVAVHCLFFAYVAYMTFNGKLLIGDYSFYTGALTSIAAGVTSFVTTTATIYEGTLFVDNLIQFMNEEKNVRAFAETPTSVTRGNHKIEFQNVSFKYPGCDKYVIKNVSTVFESGETVVLVGLNGAGKTTLIKLLTRLYDPCEGRILLDGKDLKEYEPTDLYKLFGIIFQDFGKYADTVSENIRYGDIESDSDSERIKEAAINGNAHGFIEKLPDGYDTPLMRIFEQNGTELSIGQWQKLAISRAFYGDYDILILDEPTASLDAIAEQEVFEQFDKLRRDKMTIFVSHRLSSATLASKIIVLNDGEIAEEGTHKELMKRKGVYYDLFSTQARRYIEDNAES